MYFHKNKNFRNCNGFYIFKQLGWNDIWHDKLKNYFFSYVHVSEKYIRWNDDLRLFFWKPDSFGSENELQKYYGKVLHKLVLDWLLDFYI